MTTLTEQAQAALQSGDRNLALNLLQKNLGENPRDIDAWLLLAWTVNTPEKKRECYRRVLRIDPKNSDAQAGLAALDNPESAAHSTLPPLAHPHPDVIPDVDVDPQDESLIQWSSSTPTQEPKPVPQPQESKAQAENDAEFDVVLPEEEAAAPAGQVSGEEDKPAAGKPMRLDAAMAMVKAAPKSKSRKKSIHRFVIPDLVSVPSWLIISIAIFWILVLVVPLSLAASRLLLGNGKIVTSLETTPDAELKITGTVVHLSALLPTPTARTGSPVHQQGLLLAEPVRPTATATVTAEPTRPSLAPSLTPSAAPTSGETPAGTPPGEGQPPAGGATSATESGSPIGAPTGAAPQAGPTAAPTLGVFDGLPNGLVPGGWSIGNMVAPTDVEGPAPIEQMYLFPDGTFLFLGWGKYTRVDAQTLRGCGRYQDLDNWNFCFTLKVLAAKDREVEIALSLDFSNHPESNTTVNSKMVYILTDTSTGIVYPALVGRWDIVGSQAFSGSGMELREDRRVILLNGAASKDLGTYTLNNGNVQLDRSNTLWWKVHSLGSLLFLEGGNDTSGVIILQRAAAQ